MRATGSGRMTMEQKRMEEAAKRAAQRAVNQLRMSRRTLRAGAGQVRRAEYVNANKSALYLTRVFSLCVLYCQQVADCSSVL